MTKIRENYYWLDQSQDVERYIQECLECVKHESVRKSQSLNSIIVTYSFQFIELDFINSLSVIKTKSIYILNIVCYFSKFMTLFACKTVNVKKVTWCLRLFFSIYKILNAIYCDRDQHFDNEKLREFLRFHEVIIDYNFSDFFKSTSMIEMFNRLLKIVLRKHESINAKWDEFLSKTIKSVNNRIIFYLRMSSVNINFEIVKKISINATLLSLPERDIKIWHNELTNSVIHCNHVRTYLTYRAKTHDAMTEITRRQRKNEAARYNREIIRIIHHVEDLIMLFQKNVNKLEFRWKDSFRINDYDNSHNVSFILKQINKRKICDIFHENHLKTFLSRT
jgi:hypothetical protein